jgi:tetratricopeptide (TPR) repeat protein
MPTDHALLDQAGAEFDQALKLYGKGREADAEILCRRAIAKGLDGIKVQLFLARLWQNQGRLDEAEQALRAAVRLDPASPPAQRELAQLIWMRTGDLARARAGLDAGPPTPVITSLTVRLLQWAGEDEAAAAFAAERADRDPSLNVLAARAAVTVDPEAAARRLAITPQIGDGIARAKAEIETSLALGEAQDAARRAEHLHRARPTDHYVTALLAAAWRLNADPRCRVLYDYEKQVRTHRIAVPPGWTDLSSYLADLAGALDEVHGGLTHPIGQSLRHGSQTARDLREYPHPAIGALFGALDGPIRQHIAKLGVRNYRVLGAWSVRLKEEGFHVDHVHPEGWLSSAFYVRVPPGVTDHAGWLKFGEPGTPTRPCLGAEYFIQPAPGLLALFPSYMWHGTVPFAGDQTRLACAFDIVPAP